MTVVSMKTSSKLLVVQVFLAAMTLAATLAFPKWPGILISLVLAALCAAMVIPIYRFEKKWRIKNKKEAKA